LDVGQYDAPMTTTTPVWTMGDRLRKAREHAGIGVSEMAELLLSSRSTVNNYETDKTRLTDVKLRRWAEVTGVPASWLVTGEVDTDHPSPRRGTGADKARPASTWVRSFGTDLAELLTAA